MDESTVISMLKKLGLPIKKSGESHYKIACLYQQTKHAQGFDRRPSATISVETNPSWFRCHACNTTAPFWKALVDNALHNPGQNWAQIGQLIQLSEKETIAKGARSPKILQRVDSPINTNESVKNLIKNGGLDYPSIFLEFIKSKNISEEMARKLLWCYMPEGYEDPRMPINAEGEVRPAQSELIVLPTLIKDSQNNTVCVGAAARDLRPKSFGSKYTTIFPYNAGFYVYGQQLKPAPPPAPILVVEGQFDVAHLLEIGFSAYGVFGLQITPARSKFFSQFPNRIIAFFDDDAPGQNSVAKAIQKLKTKNRLVESISGLDPKRCTIEELATRVNFDPRLFTSQK